MWPCGDRSSGKHGVPEPFEKGPGVDPDRARSIAALLHYEGREACRPDSPAHFRKIFALQLPRSGRIPLGRVQAETDDQVAGTEVADMGTGWIFHQRHEYKNRTRKCSPRTRLRRTA